MKKGTSAFTIIELIAAITIVALLAIVTIVSFNGVQGRSRDANRRADIANLAKALEQYYDDNGAYPIPAGSWYNSNNANWATFGTALNGTASGTIIDNMPADPKNNGDPTLATNYGYSYYYYTAAACGRSAGQWYLLVYRFESSPQIKFSDNDCSTGTGDTYYTNGASYYRSVK